MSNWMLHVRPKPAIPAVAVMFVAVLMPLMSTASAGKPLGGFVLMFVVAGLLGSAALAIGAGFCTFSVQVIWLLLAVWVYSLLQRVGAPAALYYLLVACAVAVAIMIPVQAWRVKTGAFVPEPAEASDD